MKELLNYAYTNNSEIAKDNFDAFKERTAKQANALAFKIKRVFNLRNKLIIARKIGNM